VELEGTFPLPEAQIDRFFLRVSLGYPDPSEENTILTRFGSHDPVMDLRPVTQPEEIFEMIALRQKIHVEASIRDYMVKIARATREEADILLGASPRATLALYQASQAIAGIQGRDYVIPDDVKSVIAPVLAHRLVISPQAQLRGRNAQDLIHELVSRLPVPVES
jgi:MoxR-like ATPase